MSGGMAAPRSGYGGDPQFESFPRFRALNVQNLLYYQVEITKRERELRQLENSDAEGGGAAEKILRKGG